MKRLLVFAHAPVFEGGGEYRSNEQTARFLNRLAEHFQVTVVAQPRPPSAGKSLGFLGAGRLSPGIRVHPLPTRGALRHIMQFILLLSLLRKHEVAYLYSGYQAILATAGNLLWRRPIALYINTDWVRINGILNQSWPSRFRTLYKRAGNRAERWVVSRSAVAYFHGGHFLRRYQGAGVMKPVVPMLDLTSNHFSKMDRTRLHSPPRLLYVGAVSPGKGGGILLEAFRILVRRGYDLRLTVVSKGNPDKWFLEKANRMGVRDRLEMQYAIPWGDELLKIYRESDVFVFPSMSEGFPRTLYEAMSQSLPMVSTPVGGVPYLLTQGREVEFVRINDGSDLARGVLRVLDDSEYRNHLAGNAYSLAMRLFREDRPHKDQAGLFVADLMALGILKEGVGS